MMKFVFWSTIIIWIVTGLLYFVIGDPVPPPNVLSVAACLMALYKILTENKEERS